MLLFQTSFWQKIALIPIFSCCTLSYAQQAHQPCHEQEIREIKTVVQRYLHQHSSFSSPVSILSPQCVSTYASAILHPEKPVTDDAIVYLHEVHDQWEVLAIGTHFDMKFLSQIPKELRVYK